MLQPSPLWPALVTALTVALSGCDAPEPPAMPEVEHVAYSFDASWAQASRADQGWEFTTDLGYDVVIDSWELRTTSVELIPCPDTEILWASLFALSTPAHAHGYYDHDISVVEGPWYEELGTETAIDIGATPVPRQAYCEAFVGHANYEGWENVSQVRGRFRAPGGSVWTDIDASSPYPLTGLIDLGTGEWSDELAPGYVDVRVTRHPVAAFEGVELDAMTATELAYEVTARLARTATVTWTLGPEAR